MCDIRIPDATWYGRYSHTSNLKFDFPSYRPKRRWIKHFNVGMFLRHESKLITHVMKLKIFEKLVTWKHFSTGTEFSDLSLREIALKNFMITLIALFYLILLWELWQTWKICNMGQRTNLFIASVSCLKEKANIFLRNVCFALFILNSS